MASSIMGKLVTWFHSASDTEPRMGRVCGVNYEQQTDESYGSFVLLVEVDGGGLDQVHVRDSNVRVVRGTEHAVDITVDLGACKIDSICDGEGGVIEGGRVVDQSGDIVTLRYSAEEWLRKLPAVKIVEGLDHISKGPNENA